MAGPATLLVAWRGGNVRFCNEPERLDLLGFERCENVLRYVRAWRQVYAMAAPA